MEALDSVLVADWSIAMDVNLGELHWRIMDLQLLRGHRDDSLHDSPYIYRYIYIYIYINSDYNWPPTQPVKLQDLYYNHHTPHPHPQTADVDSVDRHPTTCFVAEGSFSGANIDRTALT